MSPTDYMFELIRRNNGNVTFCINAKRITLETSECSITVPKPDTYRGLIAYANRLQAEAQATEGA